MNGLCCLPVCADPQYCSGILSPCELLFDKLFSPLDCHVIVTQDRQETTTCGIYGYLEYF